MDSTTKIALCGIAIWGGYLLVSNAICQDKQPHRRKNKQGLTANHIDNQIDSKNKTHGKAVKANLNIPFYSRHTQFVD